MNRCLIYCRVSDKTATDGYGMDSQERECRAYAEGKGWQVVAVHHEWHSGAELFTRPELTKVRDAMRERRFDVLLVYRLDRLSRDVNHQGCVLSECEQHGVSWDSATEDLDDSPMGNILRAVVGAFAQIERLKIAANMERGKREKVAQGKPLGTGMPPYGLQFREATEFVKGKAVTRVVGYAEDPVTIGHVKRIFADADAGLSLRAICKGLMDDSVLPPHAVRGSLRWGPATLRRILTNEIYLGNVVAYRYATSKATARDGSGRTVKHVHERPLGERVLPPEGCAPAVIDPVLFARVARRLEQNKARATDCRTTRNPEVGFLRRGGVFCATCGASCAVEEEGGGPTYRCSGRERTGCKARGGIRVDRLDPAIWNWLTAVLADEDRVRLYLDATRARTPLSMI